MLIFTRHSKWVQETTKMVCRSPEWRSGNSTVWSGTDCSTPTGWSCHASTQPHAWTGQRCPAFPFFYQCTRRSNQAFSDWSTPTGSFSQASTQQHARTSWSNQAFSVYGIHKEGSNRASTQPHAPTNHLNAVFTKSLTQLNTEIQPSLHQPSQFIRREPNIHCPPYPIRKNHPVCYRPPHLNRPEQTNQRSLCPLLEPQSEASEHSQTSHLCNKVLAITEEEISSCCQNFIWDQLTGLLNGSQETGDTSKKNIQKARNFETASSYRWECWSSACKTFKNGQKTCP